jgi:hypothetical protein
MITERFVKIVIFFLLLIIAAHGNLNANTNWEEPENCGILNSATDEFAPSAIGEYLYFNSTRENYSYFYRTLLKDGQLREPEKIRNSINVPKNNQSYLAPAGDENYFSTFAMHGGRPYLNIFSIFNFGRSNEEFRPVENLSGPSFYSHPAVSPDGSLMIFSSNRESRTGTTDLWMSARDASGLWNAPVNIEELNSAGNEITPYLHSNDTLFFATDGYEGQGDYDIFFTYRSSGKWQRPRPLFELNTPFAESDFIISDGTAFFASDRPGGKGGLDLYMAKPAQQQTIETTARPGVTINSQALDITVEKKTSILKFPALEKITNLKMEQGLAEIILEFLKIAINEPRIKVRDENGIEYTTFEDFIEKNTQGDLIIDYSAISKPGFIELELEEYSSRPPVLDIQLGMINEEALIKWQLKAVFDGEELVLAEKPGNENKNILFEIDDFTSGELYENPSLEIIFSSKIAGGNGPSDTIGITVNKQTTRADYSEEFGGVNYESYIIPVFTKFEIDEYKPFLDELISGKRPSEIIIIGNGFPDESDVYTRIVGYFQSKGLPNINTEKKGEHINGTLPFVKILILR